MAGTYQGGSGLSQLEALIRDLADFLPQIGELPPQQFDAELLTRVREIDTLSRSYPERRELLKKMCFDLCAYALDQSALLWRIRHKPSGYGGDVETLEMIYTGETHSQGVGRAWDAFIFRQSFLDIVRQRQKLLRDALREKCARQENVSVLSIAAHVRDFLQVAKFAPECAGRTLFYCLELETKAMSYYKKLLDHEKLNVQWDNRDLATLSLESSFGCRAVCSISIMKLSCCSFVNCGIWLPPKERFSLLRCSLVTRKYSSSGVQVGPSTGAQLK